MWQAILHLAVWSPWQRLVPKLFAWTLSPVKVLVVYRQYISVSSCSSFASSHTYNLRSGPNRETEAHVIITRSTAMHLSQPASINVPTLLPLWSLTCLDPAHSMRATETRKCDKNRLTSYLPLSFFLFSPPWIVRHKPPNDNDLIRAFEYPLRS